MSREVVSATDDVRTDSAPRSSSAPGAGIAVAGPLLGVRGTSKRVDPFDKVKTPAGSLPTHQPSSDGNPPLSCNRLNVDTEKPTEAVSLSWLYFAGYGPNKGKAASQSA